MTTVAIDIIKKQVASDSKCTWGSKTFSIDKITVLEDGTIIVFSGNVVPSKRFIEWYSYGKKGVEVKLEGEDFEAIVINDEGVFTWGHELTPIEIVDDPFYCSGSGEQYALAALHLGKSVEEAIELAIKLDSGSGGKVKVFTYQKKEVKKPARRKSTKKA